MSTSHIYDKLRYSLVIEWAILPIVVPDFKPLKRISFDDYITLKACGFTYHSDKLFICAKNGTYILPKDGSYVRFISNTWFE